MEERSSRSAVWCEQRSNCALVERNFFFWEEKDFSPHLFSKRTVALSYRHGGWVQVSGRDEPVRKRLRGWGESGGAEGGVFGAIAHLGNQECGVGGY